ncbi:MAG: hypothetical protein KC636_32565, partial [Myxococcales bacterium]|nr:hypothetical protein [Myxococcales bacterium]
MNSTTPHLHRGVAPHRRALLLSLLLLGCAGGPYTDTTTDASTAGSETDGSTTEEMTTAGASSDSDATTTGEVFGCEGYARALAGPVEVVDAAALEGLEGVECIAGDLLISGVASVDLAPLSALREVTGAVNLFNNAGLVSLDGLGALERAGSVFITDNPQLEDLSGASALRELVVGDLVLEVHGDDAGFPALEAIAGGVRLIVTGSSVTAGLGALQEINGSLDVYGPALQTLGVPAAVERVGGSVTLVGAHELASVAGLSALREIGGTLRLDAGGLATLNELAALRAVGGDLEIQSQNRGPAKLKSLAGLADLEQVGGGVYISSLAGLESLGGPGLSVSFSGPIGFWELPALKSFAGFGAKGAATLTLQNVDAATSLAGLEGLKSIGILTIYGCQELESLTGLSGLTSLNDVRIEGNPSLVSLNALEGVKSGLTGALFLYNNAALVDVPGLAGIPSVDGSLTLQSNPKLADVSGLAGLTKVGGDLVLEELPSLQSLAGLEALEHVSGALRVVDTGASSLAAMSSLELVARDLHVRDNAALEGLELPALSLVGHNLYIVDNPALELISGLEALTSVGKDIGVQGNAALLTLIGLGGLTKVNGSLRIDDNLELTTLDGLGSLATIGGDLQITQNPSLPTFLAENLAAEIDVGGQVQIRGNG